MQQDGRCPKGEMGTALANRNLCREMSPGGIWYWQTLNIRTRHGLSVSKQYSEK